MHLVWALVALYGGHRCISFQGVVSNLFHAKGSIIAGDSNATTLAKALLYEVLRSVQANFRQSLSSMSSTTLLSSVSAHIGWYRPLLAQLAATWPKDLKSWSWCSRRASPSS